MARKRKRAPVRTGGVNPALQDLNIRAGFPGFVARSLAAGGAIWQGTLQPRESSPVYHVVIRHSVDGIPKVHVTSPKLRPNPHLYSDGSLCLYWPKEWSWRKDQLLAQTIIPWAALWLYFYELWLDTGEWLGPSSHQLPKIQENKPSAA
jgi:hypothetical protein